MSSSLIRRAEHRIKLRVSHSNTQPENSFLKTKGAFAKELGAIRPLDESVKLKQYSFKQERIANKQSEI